MVKVLDIIGQDGVEWTYIIIQFENKDIIYSYNDNCIIKAKNFAKKIIWIISKNYVFIQFQNFDGKVFFGKILIYYPDMSNFCIPNFNILYSFEYKILDSYINYL